MKEKKETATPETVEAVGTDNQEQNIEQEITFPDPCVYCGPSVKGVAKQYTVYTGGNVPKQLRDFIRQHPAARGLVTTIGRFAKMRERLETTGTAEAMLFRQVKSITVDNGCEFQDFEGLEMANRRKGKRTLVFYCHPYSAYERGSNENMNRIIRRFFPKGTNFDNVTKERIKEVEKWINDYPRKILGWRSAADLFEEELQAE